MTLRHVTAHTTLIVALLAATAVSAGAQVPQLVEDIRWGGIETEPSLAVDLSQRKTLAIPELPSAPTIDAQLDDPAWEAAAKTDTWLVNTGEMAAPVQTKAWIGTYDSMFYVAFRAEEPNTAGILATITEDGGPTWEDDAFEMFVDGDLDLTTTRQLVINPLGTVTGIGHPGDWAPAVIAEARISEGAWTVEFALPMSDLGVTGTDFGLNFCRERKAGGGNDLTCWSPTGGSFNEPGKFGLATLPGGWLNAFSVGAGVLGQNELSATIANPTDAEQSLRVQLTWWQGDALALKRVRGPFTVAAGESREIAIGYDVQQAVVPVELELAVLNNADETVAQRQVSQKIADVLSMDTSRRLLQQGDREMTIRATMQLAPGYLSRSRVILAVFDEEMVLEAREVIEPEDQVMRAELQLPPLEVGRHSLHAIVEDGEGADARRSAEERIMFEVLPDVGG